MYDHSLQLIKAQGLQKAGCNNSDIARLNQMAAEGKSAAEIAQVLCVRLAVVESFMPKSAPVVEAKAVKTDPFEGMKRVKRSK